MYLVVVYGCDLWRSMVVAGGVNDFSDLLLVSSAKVDGGGWKGCGMFSFFFFLFIYFRKLK